MNEDNGYETWLENKKLLDEIYLLGQLLRLWRDDKPKPENLSSIIELIEERAAINALKELQREEQFENLPF